MNLTRWIFIVFIVGKGLTLSAQPTIYTGDHTAFLSPQDTIFIETNDWGEKIYRYVMKPGQTLYSLARFYGLHINELYFYNPSLRDGYATGSLVSIPIPNRAIMRYTDRQFARALYVPVYYRVSQGETMYRIAKIYFKMSVAEMMERNGLDNHHLRKGQMLFVGWMDVSGVAEEDRVLSGPYAGQLRQLQLQFMETGFRRAYKERNGAAAWNKTDSQKRSHLLALCNEVTAGNIVEVTNPWSKSTIYVKVVGTIPKPIYGEDAIIVLSPSAADLLGAIDPRFYVEMRY